jgi:hypothetical protein
MTAFVAAAKATSQMMRRRENRKAAFKVNISGQDFPGPNILRLASLKIHQAIVANTVFILRFQRNQRNKFVVDFCFNAPARAFVGGGYAGLAIVRPAAEWIIAGIDAQSICRRLRFEFNAFGFASSPRSCRLLP